MRWRPNVHNRTFEGMADGARALAPSNHFLGRTPFDYPYHKEPAANIMQNEKTVILELTVPGFTKDDLEVTIKNDELTVRGEKSKSTENTDLECVVAEFDYDSFERKFKLAKNYATEHMTAKCDNGILRITFLDEQAEPKKKSKHIEVA